MKVKCYIESELQKLKITKNYCGYKQSVLAVELALEDEDRILRMGPEIYAPVAEICGCSVSCIERNIRTVIKVSWTKNPALLWKLAGYSLDAPPSVSEFISFLVGGVQRRHADWTL